MIQVPWKEGSDILYVALFVEVGLLKMFSLVEMAIFHKTASYIKTCFAERGGFEPPNRFRRLHAFQACLFSHSSIFPFAFCWCKSNIFIFNSDEKTIKLYGYSEEMRKKMHIITTGTDRL